MLFVKEIASRIIPHFAIACQEETKRIVFMSNDTDVFIYSLAYHQRFRELAMQ